MLKKIEKKLKYENFEIFKIERGILQKITEKDIKDTDYLIFDYVNFKIVVDRDKRKIRPFVENLINTMDIETKNTKMIRFNLIFTSLIFAFIFFVFIFSMNNKNTLQDLKNEFLKIEKVKVLEDKKQNIPTILKNNEPIEIKSENLEFNKN